MAITVSALEQSIGKFAAKYSYNAADLSRDILEDLAAAIPAAPAAAPAAPAEKRIVSAKMKKTFLDLATAAGLNGDELIKDATKEYKTSDLSAFGGNFEGFAKAFLQKKNAPAPAAPAAAEAAPAAPAAEPAEKKPKAAKKPKKAETEPAPAAAEAAPAPAAPAAPAVAESAEKKPKAAKKGTPAEAAPAPAKKEKAEPAAKKASRLERWTPTATKLFAEILEAAGHKVSPANKTEFVDYLNGLSEEDYAAKSTAGHMRDFASPAPAAPASSAAMAGNPMFSAVMEKDEEPNYESLSAEYPDEDIIEADFNGTTYIVGTQSRLVMTNTPAGDIAIGICGKGRFVGFNPV